MNSISTALKVNAFNAIQTTIFDLWCLFLSTRTQGENFISHVDEADLCCEASPSLTIFAKNTLNPPKKTLITYFVFV